MAFTTIEFDITGDCHDCCNIPINCSDCPSIPSTYTFTFVGTGDLAFLNGETVTVSYTGLSGGYYNWSSGPITFGDCDVTVGWGIEQVEGNPSCIIAGNITLTCGACTFTQEMDDPATAVGLSVCDPATFTFITQQVYDNGEPPDQCFTGTVGGSGVAV